MFTGGIDVKKKAIIIIGIIVALVIIVVVLSIVMQKPAAAPTSAAADSSAITKTANNSTVGNYLTDGLGDTLYTYSGDSTGVSNCMNSCLASWPAYIDSSGTTTGLPANISTITRSDDKAIQYTYKGLPLYTFVSDTPNNVTGNGVSGFSVVTP